MGGGNKVKNCQARNTLSAQHRGDRWREDERASYASLDIFILPCTDYLYSTPNRVTGRLWLVLYDNTVVTSVKKSDATAGECYSACFSRTAVKTLSQAASACFNCAYPYLNLCIIKCCPVHKSSRASAKFSCLKTAPEHANALRCLT